MNKQKIINNALIFKILIYPILLLINTNVFLSLFTSLVFVDLILTIIILIRPYILNQYQRFINWFKEENMKHRVKKKQYLDFLEYQKRISE